MATVAISFDTLRFTKKLRQAGFTEAQAEAFAEAQKETLGEIAGAQIATKDDIFELKNEIKDAKTSLESKNMVIESEIRLMKWMLGTTLGCVIAILVRLFIK